MSSLVAALLAVVPTVSALPFDPSRMREDTSLVFGGGELGSTGMGVHRARALAAPEVVLGGATGWAILAQGPEGKFDRVRAYRAFDPSLCHLVRVGDVDGDGEPELVALLSPSYSAPEVDLAVFDLESGAPEWRERLFTSAQRPADMLLANVEGGAELEVLVINRDDLWMARAQGSILWSFPGAGGTGLAFGNVDDDPEDELVLGTGSGVTGMVLEPSRRRVEWVYTPGFGSYPTVADVDGDGRAEIFGESAGKLNRVDGVTRAPVWTSNASSYGRTLVLDFEGDGRLEVLTSGGLVDGITGASAGYYFSGFYNVSAVDSVDLGDCHLVAIWSSSDGLRGWSPGSYSSSPLDLGPRIVTSYSSARLAVGPLGAEGRTKVLWVSDEGSSTSFLGVFDLHHATEVERRSQSPRLWGPVALAQLDADPQLEYAIPEDSQYRVRVFDGEGHGIEWATGLLYATVTALGFHDLDGDGSEDLIVGTTAGSGPTNSGFLRAYTATTGVLDWKSPDLQGEVRGIAMGDVDGVPGPELLVAVPKKGVYSFDGFTRQQEWLLPHFETSAVAIGNVSGDATPDFVMGTSAGAFAAYDGPTRSVLLQGNVGSGSSISAIRIVDVDGDGAVELVIAHGPPGSSSVGGEVAIVRPSDQSVLWRSAPLRGTAGSGGALFVGDADDDGRTELVVGTRGGVSTFEYAGVEPDVVSPVWSGAAGLTSAAADSGGCCPAVDLAWGLASDAASPPVSYRVYRGSPGFVPGPPSSVAETSHPTYRDRSLLPLTAYEHVVRAVDRLGNEDANETRIATVTGPVVTAWVEPLASTACPIDRVELSVRASSGEPNRYQWTRDGVPVLGAQSSTFSASGTGTYRCVIGVGECPQILSAPAAVTVIRVPGDVSGECTASLRDAFALSAYLTSHGYWVPTPVPDVDGNGPVDKKDLDYLIDYFLAGGPTPMN